MMVARVVLPFPPSLNNAFSQASNGRRFATRAYTSWCNAAVLLMRSAKLASAAGPVAISIRIRPPDNRRRDIDNLVKPILDALVKAGVIADDHAGIVRSIDAAWDLPADRTDPGAVVEITPITPPTSRKARRTIAPKTSARLKLAGYVLAEPGRGSAVMRRLVDAGMAREIPGLIDGIPQGWEWAGNE